MFNIPPLAMGDFDLVMNLSDKDSVTKNKAIREIMHKTIQSAFPDATDEQINNFSFEYLNDVLNAMVEVNNLEISESDRKKLLAGLNGE